MAKPRMLLCGIDPGYSGAIAVIDPTDFRPVAIYDIPLHELRGRTCISVQALVELLGYHAKEIQLCIIERVASSPKMGTSSAFRFGEGYGLIQGVVAALETPFLTVSPAAWKSAMGATADKNLSRKLAAKMFPAAAPHLTRAKDDGRAEALLLAAYGVNTRDVFAAVDGTAPAAVN